MNTFLIYILEVNIYIIIFYLFFQIFLRRETYSRINRFYLIGSWLVSFILPLVFIPAFSIFDLSFLNGGGKDILVGNPEFLFNNNLQEIDPALAESQISSIGLLNILLIIIIVFSTFFFFRALINYSRLIRKIKKYSIEYFKGYKIIYTENNSPIFSFLDYIFWNRKINLIKPEGQTIFKHEIIHVKEKHSLDLIFFELLTAFFFYNPILYLYKRDIRLIHEYIADKNIINNKELTDNEYCRQLFNMTFDLNTNPLITNFYKNSNLKNRLKMITKTKSGKESIGKLFLIIPMLLVILTISSCINITVMKPFPHAPISTSAHNDYEEFIIDDFDMKDVIGEKPHFDVKKAPAQPEKDQVFFIVEDMPTFMDGNQNNSLSTFRKWISEHLKYPPIAQAHGIEGKVHTSFVVNKSGKVSNVHILRPVDPALDAEAKRVIGNSPGWTPGKQRGQAVSVAMTIPINFTLSNKDKSIELKLEEFKMSGELEEEPLFLIVEDMPEFQNEGDKSIGKFIQYVSKKLKYPPIAQENGIEGTVTVQFVIDETGKISNAKVLKPVDPILDKEALRVVLNAPKWTPGKQRGQAVKVAMQIPVRFRLR